MFETQLRRESGRPAAERVRRAQAWPLADQHHHHLEAEDLADRIADRHPPAFNDHHRADADARVPEGWQQSVQERQRVSVDRGRGQPVGDDDAHVVTTRRGLEYGSRVRNQQAAEIRPPDVLGAVDGCGPDVQHAETARPQPVEERADVEGGMHRVARA